MNLNLSHEHRLHEANDPSILKFSLQKSTGSFCIKKMLDGQSSIDSNTESIGAIIGQYESFGPEHAKRIEQDMFRRRFPLLDYSFAGSVEIGVSWWLESDEDHLELKVIYKSLGSIGKKKRQSLGPLGLGIHLVQEFQQATQPLKEIWNMQDCFVSDQLFQLKFFPGHEDSFNQWKNFFMYGQLSDRLVNSFDAIESFNGQMFYQLLDRRRFWITIEGLLQTYH